MESKIKNIQKEVDNLKDRIIQLRGDPEDPENQPCKIFII
jgi:hypothetical protein